MNQVVITLNATNKSVEFKRVNGSSDLDLRVFPNGFEVQWWPSINPDTFTVFSEDNNFVIAYREVDKITYPSTLDFYNYLRDLANFVTGTGGGGGGTASDVHQLTQIAQVTAKEERFYFDLADVEIANNIPTFPGLSADLQAFDGTVFQTLANSVYNSLDELITAFNSGISIYKLEKRTETSFYVLDGTSKVKNNERLPLISFNDSFITARVYYLHRLNKGSYPSTDLSVQDLILEQEKYASGTGLSSDLKVINPLGLTFFAVKSISVVVVAAVDGEVNIKTLDGSFGPGINLPITTPQGQYISKYEKTFERPSKNPVVIDNTGGDANNYVLINVTY